MYVILFFAIIAAAFIMSAIDDENERKRQHELNLRLNLRREVNEKREREYREQAIVMEPFSEPSAVPGSSSLVDVQLSALTRDGE